MKDPSKKINLYLLLVILTSCLFFSSYGYANDIAAGKLKAAACAGCHGLQGVSSVPHYPSLAGQKEKYLVTAINSYRSGARNDPIMRAMVAALSDDDVANIAAYYSSLAWK